MAGGSRIASALEHQNPMNNIKDVPVKTRKPVSILARMTSLIEDVGLNYSHVGRIIGVSPQWVRELCLKNYAADAKAELEYHKRLNAWKAKVRSI